MSGPFVYRVKPIWRDMDALRHVNNAVYLTYLENAREALWLEVAGNFTIYPFTLARIEIDYRSSATWRDEITLTVWVTRLGNTSFELTYQLDAAGGRRIADARSVLVMMNDGHTAPVPLEDGVRKKLSAYAPPLPG